MYLDYEVDSDDEWEEEEPGESLSNSEVSSDLYSMFNSFSVLVLLKIIGCFSLI